jgi:arabinan endo-1,5-alpha-L-arabinosidase
LEYPNHIHNIGSSDPCVLADKITNKYYMTSSGFSIMNKPRDGFNTGKIVCLVSEDLIHWSDPITIFDCNGTDFWGPWGYPATEMHYINGKYYLAGTGRSPGHCGKSMILVADNPLGPYTWLTNEPYSPPNWQTLDSTLYVDRQGHPWLVWVHEWMQVCDGQVGIQPLSDDLSHTIGGPMIIFRASEAVWGDDQIWSKTDGGSVTDGPWVHRMQDGSLIMLWTTRSRLGYATGYAKSLSGEIYGPWVQCDRPLYAHDGGHSMLFRKLDDNTLIMSMHVADRGPKMVTFFEMEEKDGDLHIVNEITGNWFHTVGGNAEKYKSPIPCTDEPAFTKLGNYAVDSVKTAQAKKTAPVKKAAAKKAEDKNETKASE